MVVASNHPTHAVKDGCHDRMEKPVHDAPLAE